MTEDQPQHDMQKNRKRKKKSFFQNARGYAKKGCFGRGIEVDQETYNYFLNIIDVFRDPEKELEDRVILAKNALEDQLESKNIVKLCGNQVCSRAIESLLPFTEPEMFESILSMLCEDLRVMCTGEFTSHVVEKLLEVSLLRVVSEQLSEKIGKHLSDDLTYNSQTSFSAEHRQSCSQFITKVSKFCLNNLEDFYADYSCYVIRKSLLTLAGLYKITIVNTNKKSNSFQKDEHLVFSTDDSWSEIIDDFSNRITKWPQFNDLPYQELSSGLLQSLCIALKYTNKNSLKSFGKQMLTSAFLKSYQENKDEKKDDIVSELPTVFTTEPSIRLLETLISVAGPKLLTQLNCMLFTGRIKILSLHKSANFSLQKLLNNMKEQAEFESLFDEISPLIEEILQIGYTGVIESLAKACERLKSKQGQFIQNLQKALKCDERDTQAGFFICVTKLKPSDICSDDNTSFVHLHGSLIIQAIFNFNKPIKFIQNMLNVKSDILVKVFCDPKGSHMVDGFVKSKLVGEQSKIKLTQHLEGEFLKMALSKHGSQALEVLFQHVPIKSKVLVLEELSNNYNQLNGSPIGQIISKKLKIETYKQHGKARWETAFEKVNKAQELFDKITS